MAVDEGIGQLLAGNPVFRRLWLGQVVSMVGDWICYVALLALLLEITGSGWMVSVLLAVSSVTALAVTPLAGAAADRFDRRRILIAADVVRMILTLGFLLVRGPGDAWLAVTIAAINVAASNFFSPAASAALPNLVSSRQVAAANSLMGATSGIMMAAGAAVGAVVCGAWGRQAAFVLDALTFLVSALTIVSVRRSFSATAPGAGSFHERPTLRGLGRDLRACGGYVARHRRVAAVLLAKFAVGLGGGVLPLLSVLPMQVLGAGDRGVGTLYACRGLGSILGAVLGPALVPGNTVARATASAAGLLLTGGFCVAFASAPSLAWAGLHVVLAYVGSSLPFVLGNIVLQQEVDDAILGRVFALDNALMMVAVTASTLLCGWGMDLLGPRQVGRVAGVALVALGGLWLAWYRGLRPLEEGGRG